MKKIILFLTILASITTACKEEAFEGKYGPAETGDEILFSAGHANFGMNGENSRTIYGDREGNEYPIYWVNNDEIGIFCPQAGNHVNTPNKEFHYKVVTEEDKSTTGTLAKINDGDNGLQWGDGDEHHFYAIYPASASQGGVSATEVKCQIPVRQDPISIKFDGTDTYTAYPNMNYAYMYAHSKASRLKEGDQPITLAFKPLVTVLEITVNGPKAGTVAGDSYQVSQVSIRSNEDIAGEFLLTIDEDFGSNDGKCTPVNNGTVSNLVTIPTYMDGKPVTLKTGQKLVVKAFMLPYANPQVSQTAVTVNMVGQGSNTKLLKTADIVSKKINITSLPALKGTDFYYWMSAMDKRTYFSQLSIPGTHNSYSFDADVVGSNTVMTAYQKLSVEQQFAAGARAFSFMVGFESDTKANEAVNYYNGLTGGFDWSNWDDDYGMYIYDGQVRGTELTEALNSYVKMLDDKISEYNNKYGALGRKCQEFIVLNINFKQLRNSGNNNEGKYTEVKRWIREVDRILDNYEPSSANSITLEKNLNANTTIEDLMGKIVVFVNYQCPNLPNKEGATHKFGGFTYNPTTDATNYVFMRQAYNTSGDDVSSTLYAQNDRDIDYPYYMTPENASGITVWKQHLERLNNPNLIFPNWSDNERVDKKISIVKNFIQQAINNNKPEAGDAGLRNWYINSLGGFCVVNDNQSYNPALGQSGNTVTAANVINGPIYDYLIDPTNNSAPIGVVLMNFLGCDKLQNEGVETNVYGKWLPQTIIENNFRFELKRESGGSTDLNYDASFSEGGNIIE